MNTQKPELLPCPFSHCLSNEVHVHEIEDCFVVDCVFCGARGPIMPTESEAIVAWNLRGDGWMPLPTPPKVDE